MRIKISNEHLENDNGDLQLFQPKYHFGQMLTTSKGQSGIVVEMGCSGKWRYLLLEAKRLELTTEFPSLLALYLETEIVPVETALLAKQ